MENTICMILLLLMKLSLHFSVAEITGWTNPAFTGLTGKGNISVDENTSVGTDFAILAATSSTPAPVSYNIIGQPAGSESFAINSNTGALSLTAGKFDYETTPSYIIRVEASQQGSSSTATVTIRLNDLNDNAPLFKFDSANQNIELADNSPAGTPVTQLTVTDADGTAPNNEIQAYTITGGNTGGDFIVGVNSGAIVASALLSNERTARYDLVLRAVDRGNPPLTGEATITVTVSDSVTIIWTNPPIARSNGTGTATGTIPESITSGNVTPIQLAATLATTYTIIEQSVDGMFSIANDGRITLASGQLDFETTPKYVITVKATDGSAKSGTATVTLNIGDVNDFNPQLSAPTIGVHIQDGAREGTLLANVSATDMDGTAANNQVSNYIMAGGNTDNDFAMSGIGEITVAIGRNISSERTPGYALVVTAEDNGSPKRTGTTTVFVLVLNTDIITSWTNPAITGVDGEGVATGVISESLVAGNKTPIKLEAATAMFYTIKSQPVTGMFTIDNSGLISLASGKLDYETKSSYVIVVVAKTCLDNTGTATVTLNIADVNDNAPEFSKRAYGVSLGDKTPAGTVVTTVSAADNDVSAANNQISKYTITGGNVDIDFDISSIGQITVSAGVTLDNTRTEGYGLVVEAVDNGETKMTGTTTVYVVVGETTTTSAGSAPKISVSLIMLSAFMMMFCLTYNEE